MSMNDYELFQKASCNFTYYELSLEVCFLWRFQLKFRHKIITKSIEGQSNIQSQVGLTRTNQDESRNHHDQTLAAEEEKRGIRE